MLGGDLVETELLDVLAELGAAAVTGCLHVTAPTRDTARLHLTGGRLQAWTPPADGPASGIDLLDELLRRTEGSWRLRLHERSPAGEGPGTPARDVLAALTASLPAPADVPHLVAPVAEPPAALPQGDPAPLLRRVDGHRTVAELARQCGLTAYAAGRLLGALEAAGVVSLGRADAAPAPRPALSPAVGPELAAVHGAVARVLEALAELVGPPRDLADAFRRPVLRHDGPTAAHDEQAAAGRLASERARADRLERERTESERHERERTEAEDRERAEAQQQERERAEAEQHERDEAERRESARIESERIESERLDRERAEAERREAQHAAELRAEQECLAAEQVTAAQDVRPQDVPERPDAASLAAFASELTATANSAPSAVPARPAEPEPEPAAPPVVELVAAAGLLDEEPQARPDTDTAALLRELASLGLEDGPSTPPAPRTPAPPSPSATALAHAQAKKKKGLFGR